VEINRVIEITIKIMGILQITDLL